MLACTFLIVFKNRHTALNVGGRFLAAILGVVVAIQIFGARLEN
jgi:hypothetical protein